MDLTSLTRNFFQFRELDFSEDVIVTGKNDRPIKFTFLVYGNKNKQDTFGSKVGVILKDWARSCGYNVILEAERLQNEAGMEKVLVVANRFSGTARELAERLGILTLTTGELVSIQKIHYSPVFDP